MAESIILNGKKINYTLRENKRTKKLRIAVYSGDEFIITVPRISNKAFIENFINEKAHWILKAMKSYENKTVLANCNDWKNYKLYKPMALRIAYERTPYYNKFYNFKYNKIIIKNQKSRWGSCSMDGNLNFNYRIALISQELADYIIVHEICHLKEMNHSANFWHLVEKIFPDYKKKRKELRNIIF